MSKIKKYLTKADKYRDRISPEYAKFLRTKYRKQQWKKKAKQKIVDTLPTRIAERFTSYDFSNLPKKKITSLFVWGAAGTGKTVACAHYYVDFIKQLYVEHSSFNKTHYFVVLSKLIADLQGDLDASSNLMKQYMECDLLVLDEFGAKKMTEYVYDQIYLIVNERYLSMLPTIINSNFSLAEIGKQFDDERIIRRIDEDYILIEKKPYTT